MDNRLPGCFVRHYKPCGNQKIIKDKKVRKKKSVAKQMAYLVCNALFLFWLLDLKRADIPLRTG